MKVIINGQTINHIEVLHLSAYSDSNYKGHDCNYVIYAEANPNGDYEHKTLFFDEMDIEQILLDE